MKRPEMRPQNVDARIDGERALWQILKEHDARLISNTQRAGPSAQTRTMTAIEYKGYRIEVSPVGKDGEHLSFRRVRPVHGQIVRPFLKKVARRRLFLKPNALSKHAWVHGSYEFCRGENPISLSTTRAAGICRW